MTAITIAEGVDGLRALSGQHLGTSDWLEITQDLVDAFAEATGDRQWIHVDVERAAAGPYGGTIAHGYLTLSLATTFMPQILETRGFSMGVNYGCEKVRFPTPAPVGCHMRCSAVLDSVTDVAGGVQVAFTLTFEIDTSPKPACVATILIRRYL
jgi:3-oxocholest-4-en-26-oate---CoA ligase